MTTRALTEPERAKLRYVRVSDPNADLRFFPDFLIAGPQRTGTTWLHAQLRLHPQIFLAEPKEIFFFNRLRTPQHPRFRSNDLTWYLRFFRDPWWRWAVKTAMSMWRYREPYRPIVRGEATASYAALDAEVIAEIAVLNPDIKVLLMIRNPIDRAWSHAKKDLVRNRNRRFEEVAESEFREFFQDEYQRRCAGYVENCDQWAAHLKPGHLFVGFFDDIASRPEELLLEVMRFLGVCSDRRYLSNDVHRTINPTHAPDMPESYRRFLEDLFRDDIEKAKARFGISWP